MQKLVPGKLATLWLVLPVQILAVGCTKSPKDECLERGGYWDAPFCFTPIEVKKQLIEPALAHPELRVELADDRVLVAGDPSGLSAACRIEDRGTGLEIPIAPMRASRAFAAGIQLADGRVLVTGGLDPTGQPRSDAELYDPEADTWAPLDSTMYAGRAGHVMVFVAEGIVEIQGGASEGAGPDYFLPEEMGFAADPRVERASR